MASDERGKVRVRIWFGQHLVAEYAASPTAANGYSAAMRERFSGLTVTVDDDLDGAERQMPAERLWRILPP